MAEIFESLKDKVKDFPQTPGVYLMKGRGEKIIYVGKAKILRNRVRSYFNDLKDHSPKTRLLVSHIVDIEYILTKTEVEAFLLEASLIKKHRPKYNIRLKDDKSYPYIRVSMADEFPRLYLSRKVKKDGSIYFGPYTSGAAVHGTIRFLNRTFRIRDCNDHMFKSRTRPCMTHQIGRCTAPCVDYISASEYAKDVESALLFLRGKDKKVVKNLQERMKAYASEEKFELAAKLRDSIEAIKAILQKQAVINASAEMDQDVVGYFGDERGCLVQTVHVRQGRVIGTRPHFLPMINPNSPQEDVREWLVSFLNQYYEENVIPDEVLVAADLGGDMYKLLEAVLFERSGKKVGVRFATDEKGRELLQMANQNAESQFVKFVTMSESKSKGLEEIQKKLHLPKPPARIECYDISNFQGSKIVASQVVFEDGVPSKDDYRRYKIKSLQEANDYAAMKEVLTRRLQHAEWEEPGLILIDGGKGQLAVAEKVLKDLDKNHIPLASIAKARTQGGFSDTEVSSTEERIFLPGRQNPVTFRSNSEALHILVGIRDEAHRFAINYHRKLREATSLESELDMVVGLGEKRKRTLLKNFESLDDIRTREAEELAKLPGFNRVLAERVLLQLNEEQESDS